jgi:hypothetical protein
MLLQGRHPIHEMVRRPGEGPRDSADLLVRAVSQPAPLPPFPQQIKRVLQQRQCARLLTYFLLEQVREPFLQLEPHPPGRLLDDSLEVLGLDLGHEQAMRIVVDDGVKHAGAQHGSPMIVRYTYGAGHVLLSTTHFEYRSGSHADWQLWDDFQYGSTLPLNNPDDTWAVLSSAFNHWLVL